MTLMLQNTALMERVSDLGAVRRAHAQIDLARLRLEATRAGLPLDTILDGIDVGVIERGVHCQIGAP
ncbi:hypothetical protein CcaverHIS641_0300020 [Cutaneotrichosporon cavernicola]|nr:hypothetical protein CcaverHIS641_0300020 [Cutaneotrichosporon cavernicola]